MKKKSVINPYNPIAALDIGTEKTCAVIAQLDTDGYFNVVGYGYRKSKGIINGAIANIKDAAEVIRETLNDAEKMTNYRIEKLIVNTPVNKISSEIIIESTKINSSSEISPLNINNLIQTSLEKHLPTGNTRLHCIPYSYYTENTNEIENPVGMAADCLGIRMSCISAPTNSLKIIDKVLSESRIEINQKVACPFAAGLGCFDSDRNGIVIDIGAGKTAVAVFINDIILYATVLPFGGNNITTQIANDLTIPHDEAERIKVREGCALYSDDDGTVIVKTGLRSDENLEIPISELNKIIAVQIKNFFRKIKEHLETMHRYTIPSKRILLTGGGSLLQGISAAASEVFEGRQVTLANPSRLHGPIPAPDSPIYSNIAGMLHFATVNKYQTPYMNEGENFGLLKSIKSLFMKKHSV